MVKKPGVSLSSFASLLMALILLAALSFRPVAALGYTVTVQPTGTGTGAITGSYGISCGSSGTTCSIDVIPNYSLNLQVQSDAGSMFTGWGGDCATSLNNPTANFAQVTGPLTCTANFAAVPPISLTVPRTGHSATLLPNGKVLLAGGQVSVGYTNSAEIFDPATRTFSSVGGTLGTARSLHTSTLLPNGKVLIVGGMNDGGTLASAEIYDPATGNFSATGPLNTARRDHTATLLNDGTVLIAGGHNGSTTALNSAEVYNPATGTFTPIANAMAEARFGHTATLLGDGRVVIIGGVTVNTSFTLPDAEIYDPATGTFTLVTGALSGSTMTFPRSGHTATLLSDGTVLVVGGSGDPGSPTSAELFKLTGGVDINGNPVPAFALTAGSPSQQHAAPSASLLTNGKVLVVGGGGNAEIYDPVNDAFLAGPSLVNAQRAGHTATMLPDGNVLIAGGNAGAAGILSDAAEFSVTSRGGSLVTALTAPPTSSTLTLGTASGKEQVLLFAGATSYLIDPTSNLGSPVWFDLTSASAVAVAGDTRALVEQSATSVDPFTVVIAGGYDTAIATTQQLFSVYNFNSGTWTAVGSLIEPRRLHRATALPNGRVLISGGKNDTTTLATTEILLRSQNTPLAGPPMSMARVGHTSTLLTDGRVLIAGGSDGSGIPTATAEIFVPDYSTPNSTGSFSGSGPLNTARTGHTATVLPDGTVLIVGGADTSGNPISSCEIFNPANNSFTVVGNLAVARSNHTATLLPSGKVVIAGGTGSLGALNSVEIYDPATKTISVAQNLLAPRSGHSAVLLRDGALFIVGGTGSATDPEYYYELGLTLARLPALNPVAFPTVTPLLSGTGFAGGPEGGSGNTANSATNYPVVQLQRVDNEQIIPLPLDSTGSWSPTGFPAKLPVNLSRGTYRVSVVNDGMRSLSQLIDVAPQVDITASGLTFPDTVAGSVSAATTFTFANNGSATFSVLDLAMVSGSITGGGNFQVSGSTCTSDLQPGASCSFAVAFSPGSTASGSITVNAPLPQGTYWRLNGTPVSSLSLSGNALAASPTYYTVDFVAGTGGTVSPSASQSVIANGSTTTVTALPNSGYQFVSWTSSTGLSSPTASIQIASVTSNMTLTANFAPITTSTYAVNIQTLGAGAGSVTGGSLNCGSTGTICTAQFNSGTQVTLVAQSSSGSSFAGWGGDCASFGTKPTISPIVSAALNCSASFQPVNPLNMTVARSDHTATLLQNGKVLVVGGNDATEATLGSAELYDPATGMFSNTGSLNTPRYWHSAVMLNDGKVLVVGGVNGGLRLNVAELYDPSTGTFTTTTGAMQAQRAEPTTTLLPNGKVLVTGGVGSSGSLNSAELYDPATDTFSATATPMTTPRYHHTATLLPNGTVLIAGGYDTAQLSSAEIYDPATNSFTAVTATMVHPRYAHTATLLPKGVVLIVGGSGDAASPTSAELYDPANGIFTATGSPANSHYGHTATLMIDGTVLVAGGGGNSEIYDSINDLFTAGPPSSSQQGQTATILSNGDVLLAGGFDGTTVVSQAEVYGVGNGGGGSLAPLSSPPPYPTLTVGNVAGEEQVLVYAGASSYLLDPYSGTAVTGDLKTGTAVTVGTSDMGAIQQHTATLLDPSTVLIAGGYDTSAPSGTNTGTTVSIARLFDFATSSWSATTIPLFNARRQHRATLLADGGVLITGGVSDTATLATTELYLRGLNVFIPGPNMSQARQGHTSTLLPDGKVLIAGGTDGTNGPSASAEIFVPDNSTTVAGTMAATGSLTTARYGHSATLLADGTVLIAGGTGSGGPLTSCEIYDPLAGTFTAGADMLEARTNHHATVLPDGLVLISGGDAANGTMLSTIEIYDPIRKSFSTSKPMQSPRSGHDVALLTSRALVIAGGSPDATNPAAPEYYVDVDLDLSRRPALGPVAFPTMTPVLSGTGFAFGTEGASGGNSSSPSDYPVGRLQRVDNGQIFPLPLDPSGSWSATSYSAKLPAGLPRGTYRATVATAGIASVPRLIDVAPLVDISAPQGLVFPDTAVNSLSTSQTCAFANSGSAPFTMIDISLTLGAILGSGSSAFTITDTTCTSDLQPGTSCSVSLAFVPTTTGPVSLQAALPKGVYWTFNGTAASSLTLSGNGTGTATGYPVTFVAGTGGTVSPTSPVTSVNGSAGPASAIPATGYHFVGWTGTSGFTSTANPVTVSNVTAAMTITATFAPDTYTVTYAAGTGGTVSPTAAQTVSYNGSTSAVTATASSGYHFVNWTGTNSFTSTANPLTIPNITGDMTVTANFAPDNMHLVQVLADTGGTATPSSISVADQGSAGPFTATPATGYHFVNWTGPGNFVSTSNTLTVPNVTTDLAFTAHFAINTYNVTLDTSAVSVQIGGPTVVNYGDTASYTFVPASGTGVADIKVNGVSVIDGSTLGTATRASDNSYTFTFNKGAITQALTISAGAANQDGVLDPTNTTGIPTVKDALMGMKLSLDRKWTAAELAHADIAGTVVNGTPVPDGKITLGDVLYILWKAVNLPPTTSGTTTGVPKRAR